MTMRSIEEETPYIISIYCHFLYMRANKLHIKIRSKFLMKTWLPDPEKVVVGFSKDGFKDHKGKEGLKYYALMMCLRCHMDSCGRVILSPDLILKEITKRTTCFTKKEIKSIADMVYKEVVEPGYAEIEFDSEDITAKTFFTLKFSKEKNLFFVENNYVTINSYEYHRILYYVNAYPETNVSKVFMFGVYMYIKSCIGQRNGLSFPTKQQISENVGVSVRSVERNVAALEKAGLLYVKRNLYIKKTSGSHYSDKDFEELAANYYIPARNVYAIDPDAIKSDAVFSELEKLYGKEVVSRDQVDGKIGFLPKL